MPMEIEAKARCPDPALVEAKLAELGATHVATLAQKDTYFRAPHIDFAETDQALRIRRETREPAGSAPTVADLSVSATLTYKGPKVDAKTKSRLEIETPVPNPGAVTTMLTAMGFEPLEAVVKTRRLWVLGELEVCMDHVEGLGDFVEVEFREGGGGEGEGEDEGEGDGEDEGKGEDEGEGDGEGQGGGKGSRAEPKEMVLDLLGRLGLQETIRTSYLELLLEAR